MLSVEERNWIKFRQRDFYRMFGKELLVDFERMDNRVVVSCADRTNEVAEAWFKDRAQQLGVDLSILRKLKRINFDRYPKEYRFMQEFSTRALQFRWNKTFCASLVGKDRTTLFYKAYNLQL
jgi:hypothetical protein